ncbi:hypothetical protein KAT89_05645, partial [candidate division WOR-3 bacterium]|nr:hypothetical protein [candidate division WOR-3 bacterium]
PCGIDVSTLCSSIPLGEEIAAPALGPVPWNRALRIKFIIPRDELSPIYRGVKELGNQRTVPAHPMIRVSERYHLALYFRGLRFKINKLHKNAISYNFGTMPKNKIL